MKKLLILLTLVITLLSPYTLSANFDLDRFSYIGDLVKVKEVLHTQKVTNIDINKALLKAGYKNRAEVVKFLLSRGANVNYKSTTGRNILTYAVQNENLELTKYLLEHNATPVSTNDGLDIYFSAVSNGNLEIVKHIFSNKTPLEKHYMLVGEFGRKVKTTLLITAIQNGYLEIAHFLMKLGANIDNPSSRGETPLLTAMRNRHYDMVNELIAKGAELSIVDEGGNSLFTYALKANQDYLALKVLEDKNFDITQWIDTSVFNAKPYIYEYYISRPTEEGKIYNLLHMASWHGASKVVGKLIEMGLKYNVLDKGDKLQLDALGFAAWNGHLECVQVLVENGADPYITYKNSNPEGYYGLYYFGGLASSYTALSLATISQNSSTKLIKYLMSLPQSKKYQDKLLEKYNETIKKVKSKTTTKVVEITLEKQLSRAVKQRDIRHLLYLTRGDDRKLLEIVQSLAKEINLNEYNFLYLYFNDREDRINKEMVKEFVKLNLKFNNLKKLYLLYSDSALEFIIYNSIFKKQIVDLHKQSDLMDIASSIYNDKRKSNQRIEQLLEIVYWNGLKFNHQKLLYMLNKNDELEKIVRFYGGV